MTIKTFIKFTNANETKTIFKKIIKRKSILKIF